MGFWFLDEKSQLALLVAGLMSSVGAAGCDRTAVMDPVPPDSRVDHGRDRQKTDKPQVVDPAPPDLRLERRPADLRRTDFPPVVDMLPPDLRADYPLVVDMVPPDAAASGAAPQPLPQPQPSPPNPKLPLDRDLRAKIVARQLPGGALELRASPLGREAASLSYRWKVSGGTLDQATAATVRWVPPGTPGPHLAQVTVRDGDRAVAVEVFLHGTK